MVYNRLLNGRPKVTIIERFDRSILLLCPDKKREFESLETAKKFIHKKGWEVAVEHLHECIGEGKAK